LSSYTSPLTLSDLISTHSELHGEGPSLKPDNISGLAFRAAMKQLVTLHR
jgi:hypothetical protein